LRASESWVAPSDSTKKLSPSTGMIARNVEFLKNSATSGARADTASASVAPIATVQTNVVWARAGSSSGLETISA